MVDPTSHRDTLLISFLASPRVPWNLTVFFPRFSSRQQEQMGSLRAAARWAVTTCCRQTPSPAELPRCYLHSPSLQLSLIGLNSACCRQISIRPPRHCIVPKPPPGSRGMGPGKLIGSFQRVQQWPARAPHDWSDGGQQGARDG